MYFKRLEMFGFKSFAERTKINFEKGITTIVGPNGCGKSNIADGIKWVLGEQSAKAMRGSVMQDVIFNGTDLREPLGLSEVSLTLSNEKKFLPIEYDEVTIARRLYRSGESEYFINKNLVRLKDINELLMGSGIGTEAYSLIEQGKIDQILSANPEERRIVFEEASGITKYKSKKKEAIRRLEQTEQNLLRVNDITKEVERQINSIERQAKKAKRYQELFDKLKDLDTKLAGHRYKEMKEKKDTFDVKNSGIKDRERQLNNDIMNFNREVEELKAKSNNLNLKISQYRSDQRDTDISLHRTKDRISLDKERMHELYRHQTDLKNEINSLDARIADIAKTMGEFTNRLIFISENSKSKEDQLIIKEKGLSGLKDEIVKNNESIKNNKLKVVDIFAAQSGLRNEITKATSDIQNVSARLRRLNLEKENVSKELSGLDRVLSEIRSSVNISISKVEGLEKERMSFQNSLKKEKEAFDILEKRIDELKNYILSLHSKLNLLKDLAKRHEGFTGGAQGLLNSLSNGRLKIDGLCEPLAELLEPKRGYEPACEAALKDYLQSIVVDSWKTASTAIDYLKRNNLGKASFIIYDLSDFSPGPLLLNNQLVSGKILDFMKFDSRYNVLFMNLLSNAFLVNNIEDGVSVLRDLTDNIKKNIRLVTKDGDIVSKDMITGGGVIKDFTASVLGRQKRIREIGAHIVDSEEDILKLKQELSTKKGLIEDWQAKIKRVEDGLRSEEIGLAQKKSEEANLEKNHKKIREELDLVDLELEESILRKNELMDKETELKRDLESATEKEMNLQKDISESQRFIEEGSKRKEGLLVAITQIQTELESLKRQEDEFYKQAQGQKNYHQEQLNILNSKKGSLEESFRRQKGLKEEVDNLEKDLNGFKERSEIIEKELGIIVEENTQLKTLIDDKKEKRDKRQEELNTIKDKVHDLQMEETQIAFKMESLRNKISQIYKIDLEGILSNLESIEDPEALQNEVNQFSQTIEKMGPVNLVAIDEHNQLQERISFLKRQQEDLLSAKDSLLKAIKKINQTTRELFMETFSNIQAEFKNYFRFLFGGGRAEIVLLDEGDVLESGIEIIVRPPGKKLQTISLLSGGERALTAIALLFAIFKTKPSPFCVLDEIDAPLDESNIDRFSKALSEFAKKSQFIIITHNKKTISISDVMYGITMEQLGVSKIISVKFAKKAQEEVVLA